MNAQVFIRASIVALVALAGAALVISCSGGRGDKSNVPPATTSPALMSASGFSYAAAPRSSTRQRVDQLNATCVVCHLESDNPTMHTTSVRLACVDCHGGNSDVNLRRRTARRCRLSAGNEAGTRLAAPAEVVDVIGQSADSRGGDKRGIGRLHPVRQPRRSARRRMSCGACHEDEVRKVENSMMAHGAMLWSAALYNNGAINRK